MKRFPMLILGLLAIAALCASPFFGAVHLDPFAMNNDMARSILLDIRLPRTITAFSAGAFLALCGLVFQALFRNDLADPFTLGTASGASCGAAAAILFGASALVPLGALTGAILSMAIVFGLAGIRRDPSPLSLLLAGIATSFLFSSLMMFMQNFSSLHDSVRIVRWLMGGIETCGWTGLPIMLSIGIAGTVIVIALLPTLDQMLLGDDIARSHGINVSRMRFVLSLAATLVTGGVVAVCGPIGFVGLMVPHACRSIFGHSHRKLLPSSMIAGGTLLVVCDIIARTVAAPSEIPTGVITSLLGGPFFLLLLARKYDR